MIPLLTLTLCIFPTSFDFLAQVAALCGIALIITAGFLLWKRRFLRLGNFLFLTGLTCVGSIWSFVLAVVTSKNYLECAGIPGASAEMIRRADESVRTLYIFEALVGATCALTFFLVLISIMSVFKLYSPQPN